MKHLPKYVVTAVAIAGLLGSATHAQARNCWVSEDGEHIICKKKEKPAARRTPQDDRGITSADKENLDRARARSTLQNIESEMRRQRYGQ
jgi:hypothetical protein